jgi:hypothetical protein
VEIHAASGYLPNQFICDATNKRSDAYGGSVEDRCRFVLELTQAVCSAWDRERVGIRLSPSGLFNDMSHSDPVETFDYLINRLNTIELAYLHLVEPMIPVDDFPQYLKSETPHYRNIYTGTIITNGGYDRDTGNQLIQEGTADLVSYGKHFLANPDLPKRFEADAAWLNEFASRYKAEIGLPFKVQYNPKLVKPETIRRRVDIGLHRVKFGIEAGTDKIRNQIFHRPGKNSKIVDLVRSISNYDVKIRDDLILDNPCDTEETLADTIDLLMRQSKPLRFNLSSLQYFPGYPLTRKASDDGHIRAEEVSPDSLQKKNGAQLGICAEAFTLYKKTNAAKYRVVVHLRKYTG